MNLEYWIVTDITLREFFKKGADFFVPIKSAKTGREYQSRILASRHLPTPIYSAIKTYWGWHKFYIKLIIRSAMRELGFERTLHSYPEGPVPALLGSISTHQRYLPCVRQRTLGSGPF